MARYTAEQIYAFARAAGFSPDRAATMTAVALAESGGNSNAHNPHGEDSRGLWQINVRAHPHLGQTDLYDPVQNAKAAFAVSQGGEDISPWTTTHGGISARYLRFRAQAEQAAIAYGDGPGRGMWEGTSGYGDHTSAGEPRGGGTPGPSATGSGSDNVNVSANAPGASGAVTVQPGEEYGIALDEPEGQPMGANPGPTSRAGEDYGIALDTAVPPTGTPPGGTPATPPVADTPAVATQTAQTAQGSTGGGDPAKLQAFLDAAVSQTGDRYVFGAEAERGDANPSTFDCSELVEWAAGRAGVSMPDGSWIQYQTLAKGGNVIPVEQAVNTPGALLFSFSSDPMSATGRPSSAHVAISLGDGKTIEARGTQYGVGSWDANAKRFQYAVVIPELAGTPGAPYTPNPSTQDTFDYRVNHDPVDMDNSPAVVAASHQLTNAAPPAGPAPLPEPVAEPVPHTVGDVDSDGMDDALAYATEFAAHPNGSDLSDVDSYDDATPGH